MISDLEKARRFDRMLDYITRLKSDYETAIARLERVAEEKRLAGDNSFMCGCLAQARIYRRCLHNLKFIIRKNNYGTQNTTQPEPAAQARD